MIKNLLFLQSVQKSIKKAKYWWIWFAIIFFLYFLYAGLDVFTVFSRINYIQKEVNQVNSYKSVSKNTFEKQVFEYDQVLLKELSKILYDEKNGNKLPEIVEYKWKILLSENYKSFSWNLFNDESLNFYFNKNLSLTWNLYKNIYKPEFTEVYTQFEEILKIIENNYVIYTINHSNNKFNLVFALKAPWKLIDEWTDKNLVYDSFQKFKQSFYWKLNMLIKNSYKDLSSIVTTSTWWISNKIIEDFDNINKKSETYWTQIQNKNINYIVFNFYIPVENKDQYIETFLTSETFYQLLFNNLLWLN